MEGRYYTHLLSQNCTSIVYLNECNIDPITHLYLLFLQFGTTLAIQAIHATVVQGNVSSQGCFKAVSEVLWG